MMVVGCKAATQGPCSALDPDDLRVHEQCQAEGLGQPREQVGVVRISLSWGQTSYVFGSRQQLNNGYW